MTPPRRRLDEALVQRGLAHDVAHAQVLVAEGNVLVGGSPALNAARRVAPDEPVVVVMPRRFVGRGGDKLQGALDVLEIDVASSNALDVGASTGGFTDCLLSRGASRVLAVDVGRRQLHERLLADHRVRALEATNVLDVRPDVVVEELGSPPDVITVDLSFTSVTRVIGHLVSLASPGARIVVLVKPQFEAERPVVSKGRGVVADTDVWREVLVKCASAIRDAGAGIIGLVASPLKGSAGNVEFFVAAVVGQPGLDGDGLATLVDRAIEAVPR